MLNINKLKGKIVERGMNVGDLAELLGVNKSTVYRKLQNEGQTLTIAQVDAIANVLELTGEEVNAIFFSQYVA